MRWGSTGSPHLLARCKASDLKACSRQPFRQWSSSGRGGLSILNPSVAAILATPPSTDSQPCQQITVVGFVRTVRNQKLRSFVEVGDGSTVYPLQAVLEPLQAKGLTTGTSVAIRGVWQQAPPGKEQKCELKADEVTIIGSTDGEVYPIQKKFQTPEYLRTVPHLRLRTPFNALLARFRSDCDFYLSKFFRDQEFVRLQPPILTSSDCEGASEVFTVSTDSSVSSPKQIENPSEYENDHFFRGPKYLTVSSQLHLEAFVHEHQKVWSLSPTFRAEKSDTPRHLSEFWMLEAEIQTESLGDVIGLVEQIIRSVVINLKESKIFDEILFVHRGRELSKDLISPEFIRRRWDGLLMQSWPCITYSEAIERLKSAVESQQVSFINEPSWTNGLQLEHERFIATDVGQGRPVFVTFYPRHIKPFYMLPSETNEIRKEISTVACFDLLLPDVCEVAGGSLREHRPQHLINSMGKQGVKTRHHEGQLTTHHSGGVSSSTEHDDLDWYVDLRRFGSVPHGGFGLGLDRLISYLTCVHNIKDVVPWPRCTVRPRHATLSTEKPKVSYYAFRRNFGTGFALPAKSDNEGDMELAISIIVQQRQMEQLGQLRDHKNQTWTSRAYRYGSSDGE